MTAAQQTAEADRMTAALKAVPAGDLITIQVVSNRERGESRYPAPVGPIDKASMVKLADAVADAGGTRNAFNRTALQTGAPASSGATYTLVGWAGAGEGAGAKAAAGLDGAGDAPLLSGALRPGHDSELRPAEITYSTANPQTLQNLLVAKPTGAWPLDDDPGAMRAISYLGSTDQRLGPDPRSAYWTQIVRRVDDELDHRRTEVRSLPERRELHAGSVRDRAGGADQGARLGRQRPHLPEEPLDAVRRQCAAKLGGGPEDRRPRLRRRRQAGGRSWRLPVGRVHPDHPGSLRPGDP